MAAYEYDDFWVEFSPRAGGGYSVAARAPDGETSKGSFTLPFTNEQLEAAVRTLGYTRAATTRDIGEVTTERRLTAEQLGGELADALLIGPTGDLYSQARSAAIAKNRGVRLWLSLGKAPGLLSVPWEFLYLQPTFLASQRKTPIVRFLSTNAPVAPRRIEDTVRILGVVASPDGLPKLEVAQERQRVDDALAKARQEREVTIDWLDPATPKALRLALQKGEYHILHFVGHSGYVDDGDAKNGGGGGGVIFLENEDRSAAQVSDAQLVNLLGDQDSLRLVVLNSCEGARTSVVDPFAGIATTIVALGIPAVVAMQFEISDKAAITFAEELYQSLIARQDPIDVAVAEARKAVFTEVNETEWATPVLFLRNEDGRLFDFAPVVWAGAAGAATPAKADAPGVDDGIAVTGAGAATARGATAAGGAAAAGGVLVYSPRPEPAPTRGIGLGGIVGGVIGGIAGGVVGGAQSVANAARGAGKLLRQAGARGGSAMSKPVVNTGLSKMDRPDVPLNADVTLAVDGDYLFWMEIAPPISGSIEEQPVGAPVELVAAEALLEVVLFDVSGSPVVIAGADEGRLKLVADGSAVVVRQPAAQAWPRVSALVLARRLLFPLQSPTQSGDMTFRCNLYHAGVLIQSRLVRCEVQRAARYSPGALRSRLDYLLARTLTPDRLAGAQRHELSVLVNDNQDGTHGFYFASGKGRWKRRATFDADALQAYLDQARGALRLAAWGSAEPWQDEPYLYDGKPDRSRLLRDLIPICLRGYAFYSELIDRLAGTDAAGESKAEELTTLMRTPGSVQIALLGSPRSVLPAALIYDYDLDTGASLASYTFCEQFLEDLAKPNGLRDSICFAGSCPNRVGNVTVICPSGLWGYRHSIGLPISLAANEEWSGGGAAANDEPDPGDDPPGVIDVLGVPQLAVGVSTDPAFTQWPQHEIALRALRPELGWHFANTRNATFDMLQTANPHIVYFYCHGGVANGRPFIQVGPKDDQAIFSDNLKARHVHWGTPRPLVFINGCRTTALEPKQAHELVSGFVTIARASGVIGTEITIFEPLARAFAEAFLRAFIGGSTVGDAVRTARLDLLQEANPLGLAYTAYALSNLRLGKQLSQ